VRREEAEAHCRELNERDRGSAWHWFAQRSDGDEWRAVKIEVPAAGGLDPLKASIESRPRPQDPPDTRTGQSRNLPFGSV
jgi:hypothetical protein